MTMMIKDTKINSVRIASQIAFLGICVFSPLSAFCEEEQNGHTINFNNVPIAEVIRFVSRISEVNFIFDNKELEFNVTLASGKPVSSENVLKALLQTIKARGFGVSQEDNYYVIHKAGKESKEVQVVSQPIEKKTEEIPAAPHSIDKSQELLASLNPPPPPAAPVSQEPVHDFFVYKLQYHQGSEIEESIKRIASDMQGKPDKPIKLLTAIQSMQWVKATNSLLCSADSETIEALKKLVSSLDVPLKQVFIEVLVVETDMKKASEFGLEWALGGKYKNKLGFGLGNFPPNHHQPEFAKTLQSINATHTPTGLNQIPVGSGFDLGVIGDIIRHKGLSYLSLGSLVSALQADGDSTIVLNQKIITQDNKNSTIFVGDNIPFTGSVVQTVGQSQQTTANIEYRDIGVNLSIKPMLGEGDIITLDIDEEITESHGDIPMASTQAVNGIRTTKTNMVTHVHVPDKHFLVLSGMVRNAKSHHKTGLPCLGGLPVIGSLFSKTKEQNEKRNILIFVRPHIIHSFEEYGKITESQPTPIDFPESLEEKRVNE
jgi:type III secretion protein C